MKRVCKTWPNLCKKKTKILGSSTQYFSLNRYLYKFKQHHKEVEWLERIARLVMSYNVEWSKNPSEFLWRQVFGPTAFAIQSQHTTVMPVQSNVPWRNRGCAKMNVRIRFPTNSCKSYFILVVLYGWFRMKPSKALHGNFLPGGQCVSNSFWFLSTTIQTLTDWYNSLIIGIN